MRERGQKKKGGWRSNSLLLPVDTKVVGNLIRGDKTTRWVLVGYDWGGGGGAATALISFGGATLSQYGVDDTTHMESTAVPSVTPYR